MGFRSIVDVTNAIENGQAWTSNYYKSGGPFLGVGRWNDLSVGAGSPTYQPYAAEPLVFTPQTGGTNKFIYTGPNIAATAQKYLFSWQFYTAAAITLSGILIDSLGFYCAIDAETTDEQTFDNTLPLPRHATGEGVQMYLLQTAPGTANGLATINYTNSDGVAKSISVFLFGQGTIGSSNLTSFTNASSNAYSAFSPLTSGDKGVRSVQSIQLSSALGGLLCLVLMKPLCQMQTGASAIPTEKTLINQFGGRMPEILPGAALSIISTGNVGGTIGPIFGQFNFVWG